MSRSAIDATRFTATSPHAYSKPTAIRSAAATLSASSTSSSSPPPRASYRFPGPGPATPPGTTASGNYRGIPKCNGQGNGNVETPLQKVARLRAARNAENMAKISRWDKIVVAGRAWADRAHRITVYGLIGLTVIAGGITLFSLTDMIIYNRRKRDAWYRDQNIQYLQRLTVAREAAAVGTADEDQILIINQARAREEAAKRDGIFKRGFAWFTGGLKNEDNEAGDGKTAGEGVVGVLGEEGLKKMGEETGRMDTGAAVSNEGTAEDGTVNATRQIQPEAQNSSIAEQIKAKRREGEKVVEDVDIHGGPLDQLAAQTTTHPGKAKSGWTSWITGK